MNRDAMTEADWRAALDETLQAAQKHAGTDTSMLIVLFGELLASALAAGVEPQHTDAAIQRVSDIVGEQTRVKQSLLQRHAFHAGGAPVRH